MGRAKSSAGYRFPGHVRNPAPLVAGEQAHGQPALVEHFASRGEPQSDLAAFRLVEASEISSIELDLPVAEVQFVAGQQPVYAPRFGRRIGAVDRDVASQTLRISAPGFATRPVTNRSTSSQQHVGRATSGH
ncbi:hypothetical protein [Bosea sp. UC22_33]|uniref:hypothetical protein n=1 Tax=Bosea sp. UC22_33 TaxID=3350165 RepID=UPI0036706999